MVLRYGYVKSNSWGLCRLWSRLYTYGWLTCLPQWLVQPNVSESLSAAASYLMSYIVRTKTVLSAPWDLCAVTQQTRSCSRLPTTQLLEHNSMIITSIEKRVLCRILSPMMLWLLVATSFEWKHLLTRKTAPVHKPRSPAKYRRPFAQRDTSKACSVYATTLPVNRMETVFRNLCYANDEAILKNCAKQEAMQQSKHCLESKANKWRKSIPSRHIQ